MQLWRACSLRTCFADGGQPCPSTEQNYLSDLSLFHFLNVRICPVPGTWMDAMSLLAFRRVSAVHAHVPMEGTYVPCIPVETSIRLLHLSL
jgi:hypothetical protein